MRIQFGKSRRNFAHRDVPDVRDARDGELPGLPHVDDERPGARLSTGFELAGADLVYHDRLESEPGRPPGVLQGGHYGFEQALGDPPVLGDAPDEAGVHDRRITHDHEQAATDLELALEAIVRHREGPGDGNGVETRARDAPLGPVLHGIRSDDFGVTHASGGEIRAGEVGELREQLQ